MILKASLGSFSARQSLKGNYYGPAKFPIDQGPIHLKSTILDPKYKNSPYAKSNVQYLISTFNILIMNLELTWALDF